MSSHVSPQSRQQDPENRLWSRMPLRRLEAEAVRDALLVAADALDDTMGGSMLHVANREFFFNHTSEDKTTYDSQRRSLYLPIVRNHLYDVFQLFDYNDASVSNGNRATSVIAPQALFVMNSPFVERISQQLAGNARQREPDDPQQRVVWLYEKVFVRTPAAAEVERVLQFIERASQQMDGDDLERQDKAWQAACQALLCANEFLYY